MTNEDYLKEVIKKAEGNIYHQLLSHKDSMTKDEYKLACIRYSPHSFLCFVQAMCGPRFEIRDFHIVIAAVLEHLAFGPENVYKRLILAAPPRSGKSTITQLFTAWLTGLNPRVGNMFASYGQRLSSRFMSKIHAFMAQPEYLLCFPNFPGFTKNSKTELESGGYFTATSVGGASTGFDAGTLDMMSYITAQRTEWVTARAAGSEASLPGTPGLLTVDDPLKAGSSDADFDALDDWWTDEYNTRRTGNWIQLLIATRFSLKDLHGKLLAWDGLYDSEENPEGWLYLNITALRLPVTEWDPVGREYEDEELWPGHSTLNQRELLSLRLKNPQRFGALYQGNPVVTGTGTLKISDLKPLELGPDRIVYTVLGIDGSSGMSEECDNTGFFLVGLCSKGLLWCLFSEDLNLNFIDLRAYITEFIEKWNPDEIAIELTSNGVALFQELDVTPERFNFYGLATGYYPRMYGSKEKRLTSVLDLIKLSRWAEDGNHDHALKELGEFPYGASDNLVDALAWALITMRLSYESFSPEEFEGEEGEGALDDYLAGIY